MSGTNPTPNVSLFEQEGAALTSTRITELNRNDVLMGRGAVIDRFEGNVRFRELIKARKVEYSSTSHPEEKNRIVFEIVTTVQQTYNGRFLRRVQDTSLEPALTGKDETNHDKISVPSSSTAPQLWTLVDHKSAIDKVKQALRDCTTGTSNVETTTTATTTFISRPNVSPHGVSTMWSTANMNINNHVADIEAQSTSVAPTALMIQPPQIYHEQQHASGHRVDPIITSLLLHPALQPPLDRYSSALNSSVLPMLNDILQRPPQQQEQQSSVPHLPQYSIPHISPDQTIGLATAMLLNRGDSGHIATLEGQPLRRDAAFVSPLHDKNQLSIAPRAVVSESLLHVLQLRRHTHDTLMSSGYDSHPLSSSALFAVSGSGAAVPALRWNEIPDVYLQLLPRMQEPYGPTFTGDDLQILLRGKTSAEIAGDYHCWSQIRLIFESVVELPTVRHELCPADVYTLITVLQGMKIQSNGGCRGR